MEAVALYQRFKDNLETIISLLDKGTDIRTTAYKTSIPLEVKLFSDILIEAKIALQVKTEGFGAIEELQRAYLQQEKAINSAMEHILKDKRSSMKTPEGRI